VTQLVNSVFYAGLYASLALGLTLVFGVMRLVNLAHGDIIVGGGYLAVFFSTKLGLDPMLSLVLIVPVMIAIMYPLQRGLLNPLLAHGEEPPLVATFGISLIVETIFLLTYSSNTQSLNPSYGFSGVDILGTTVRVIFVIAFVVGVTLVLATHFGLTRLRFGKALRAASEDPEAAASLGIDVKHVYALTFAVAAGLSAFAGVEIGVAFALTPTAGLTWLLLAFTVMVLGGMGSVIGTLAGGFIVALAQEYGALAFGPQYQNLIVFGLLVIMLVVRPNGIFGRKLT
jgi:branched-chain amino acid transport system permease protein